MPATLFGATAWHSRMADIAGIDHRNESIVTLLAEQLEKAVSSDALILSMANNTLAHSVVQPNSEIVRKEMLYLKTRVPQIGMILVVSRDGIVTNSSNTDKVAPINVTDRIYFQQAKRDPDPSHLHIDGVLKGRIDEQPVVVIAQRRESADGSFKGLVLVTMDQQYFDQLLGSAPDHVAASIRIMLTNGRMISCAPPPPDPKKSWQPTAKLLAQIGATQGPMIVDGVPTPRGPSRAAFLQMRHLDLIIAYAVTDTSVQLEWLDDLLPSCALFLVGIASIGSLGLVALRWYDREQMGHLRLQEETNRRHAAEEKLQHLHRMEAIGQLTAGISHDFNNLLTAISANAEMLEKSANDAQRKRVQAILFAVNRGAKLIRQMLTFARRQILQRSLLDINEHLRSLDPLLSSAMAASIRIEYDLAPESVTCLVDPAEFELAIINIVSNSKAAMPRGGKLFIETRVVLVGDSEADLRRASYARIKLTDNGEGMSSEVLQHAFEPFFTTRELDAGTGLGLSQVFGFAKQAGGAARIESQIDVGTTVTIFLPTFSSVVSAPGGGKMTNETNAAKNILVVDDTEDVLDVVADALVAHGFSVTRTTKPADALELIENGAFDLLITDIVMPGSMSGIDLAVRARERQHAIRVLLMTGYSDQAVSGGMPLLRKPFRTAELLGKVEAVLGANGTGRWN